MELEPHTIVLLRWPPTVREFSEAEVDELQEQHLAYLASLRQQGKLLVSGPLDEQPDDAWRGLCVYAVGPEEARRLAEQDPSVRAGRLAIETLRWLVPRGLISFGQGAS